jgi:hypothetical protein
MLKILSTSDPLAVDQLVVAIYGQPGIGKTTLAFTAEKPLLLDFDRGAYRAYGRKDTVQIGAWPDVTDISKDDLAPYQTVIVDTAGRALDMLTADIIKRDAKMGKGGALTLQGYGRLKAEFSAWLKSLRTFGKDIVLIAHAAEQKNGDDTVMRLDVQGGSKDEIYKSADVMGWLNIYNSQRNLNFNPADAAYGKNPGNLPVFTVQHGDGDLMARIIRDTKQAINTKSEAVQAEYERLEAFMAELAALDGPDAIQRMVDAMRENKSPDKYKKLLVEEAKKQGFGISKAGKVFALSEAAAA